MLDRVSTYVYDKRKGLSEAAGVVGGIYIAQRYVSDRLEEVKDRLEQERAARLTLTRRFDQTQEDVSYTVMALIPTLAEQVLEQMDVEAITQELQSRARTQHTAPNPLPTPHPPPSSVDVVHDGALLSDAVRKHEARSDASSAASWVKSMGTLSGVSSESVQPESEMSNSIATEESNVLCNDSAKSSTLPESVHSVSAASDSSDPRTKVELWNEVKMMTFTRTLTTLYSTTLLCLLTTVQLSILARSKYVSSIIQLEHDERLRDILESELSMTNILLGGTGNLENLMSSDASPFPGVKEERDDCVLDSIDEMSENKYLTLSWWLLHVGWKDVGERVRRGVEEVFNGVSLKTKLAAIDLHRLICDVRRRVEHEITFEGKERGTTFLSSLLPPTPETVQHVLTQNGFSSGTHTSFTSTASLSSPPSTQNRVFPSATPLQQSPALTALIEETRCILASPDFSHTLDVALDRTTNVLVAGLSKIFSVDDVEKDTRIRLAGLLPGLARWSQSSLQGLPNELVDNVLDVREVRYISAIIFSRFEERFI